jgi:Glutaredoxin and related proteins
MKKCALFIIPILFFLYGAANADFYKWEDESGATHITDYPPPQAKSPKNVQVYKDNSDNSATDEEQDAKSKTSKRPNVTLYTKNNCADCDKAREFLKSKNVTFTEYNMDQDNAAAAKRKDIDNSEDVPFAIINRNQVYGFSESVYNRALKPTP